MSFKKLFSTPKPLIGCIHLRALPGAPLYEGSMRAIFQTALEEAAIFQKHGFQGLLIENFRDRPFFPDRIPPETIAAMTAVGREIARTSKVPVGINALRNDAMAALG